MQKLINEDNIYKSKLMRIILIAFLSIAIALLVYNIFFVMFKPLTHYEDTLAQLNKIIVEEKRLIEQLREFTESKEPEAESSNQKLFLSKPDWYQILFPCIE